MPIIIVIDNKNNRWKEMHKKTKIKRRIKRTSGTKAIVNKWKVNDFVVRLI